MDDRGRLAMPKRFQDAFRPEKSTNDSESVGENGEKPEKVSGQLVITPNLMALRSRCLLIYPLAEWEKVEQQMLRFPAASVQGQHIKKISGELAEVELDDKGRFVVPSNLLKLIGLSVKTKTCLIGQQNRLALWDKELWDAELAFALAASEADQASGELSEELRNFVM